MDFMIEECALEVSILESADTLCTLADNICLYVSESDKDDQIKVVSSFEVFKLKALEIIGKVIEALAKFFKEVKIRVDAHVQQIKLNKKLEELKDIMAKKKAKALHSKYSYFDIKKYKDYYSDFINRYTMELKKGLNKDFKSIEEYERWRVSLENKLADFNFKLSDEEQWKLSVSVNSAVELSEKEAINRQKNLDMVEKEGSKAIKNLESYYKTLTTEKSFVNYNNKKLHIFKLQNSFIGYVCSKLAQCIKTVVRFITKHTFLCVTALIVLLVAV